MEDGNTDQNTVDWGLADAIAAQFIVEIDEMTAKREIMPQEYFIEYRKSEPRKRNNPHLIKLFKEKWLMKKASEIRKRTNGRRWVVIRHVISGEIFSH